ncbi:hypothetical protein EDB87DRAFT_1691491 [Lactarius vividus]|nr:hypothetical protein EDB87DRAFT_1691491 [Lactarius vividus]
MSPPSWFPLVEFLSSASCVVLVLAPPDQATSDVLLLALRRVPVHRALTVVPRGARLRHEPLLLVLLASIGNPSMSKRPRQSQGPAIPNVFCTLAPGAPIYGFIEVWFRSVSQDTFLLLHMGPAALHEFRSFISAVTGPTFRKMVSWSESGGGATCAPRALLKEKDPRYLAVRPRPNQSADFLAKRAIRT